VSRFLGAEEQLGPARVVLYGAPLDATTSFRPGTRFGPRQIRAVSDVLETYSPVLGRDLCQTRFYDGGDLALESETAAALSALAAALEGVFAGGRRLLLFGGEHLVTLAGVRAARRWYPELVVLWMDAHADLRDDYQGARLSHATVARRVLEEVGEGRLIQVGVRSVAPEERALASRPWCHHQQVLAPVRACRRQLEGRPVYVSVDIDVLDPAFAPGTGAPEPGGIDTRELLSAIYALDGLDLVAADIVEVAPAYDVSDLTAITAAKLARELLLLMSA
jgi:agmatinase